MKDEKCSTDVTKTCDFPARIFNSVLIAFQSRSLLATRVSHFCPAFFIGTLVRQSEINCHFTLLRGT